MDFSCTFMSIPVIHVLYVKKETTANNNMASLYQLIAAATLQIHIQ
jgi:hypothetical protein